MTKQAPPKYSPEVRERAVRMVFEHAGEHASQWAAIGSIAAKIGCTAETLRGWVRQTERDRGNRPGPSTDEQKRVKALEREVRELRQANEILRKCKGRMNFPQIGRVKNPQMVGVVKCFCLGWPPCLLVGAHGVVPPVVLTG